MPTAKRKSSLERKIEAERKKTKDTNAKIREIAKAKKDAARLEKAKKERQRAESKLSGIAGRTRKKRRK